MQRAVTRLRRIAPLLVLAAAVVLMHSGLTGSSGCPDMGTASSGSAVSTVLEGPGAGHDHDAAPPPGRHASSSEHVCLATMDAASLPDVAGPAGAVALLEPRSRDYRSSGVSVLRVMQARPPPRALDPVVELSVNRV